MKNNFLLFFVLILCIAPMSTYAQLKVANTGKVGVAIPDSIEPLSPLSINGEGQLDTKLFVNGKNTADNSQIGIYSKLITTAKDSFECAVYGYTYGQADMHIGIKGEAKTYMSGALSNIGNTYGVYGTASGTNYGRNYGVYGFIQSNQGYGAGIFGSNSGAQLSPADKYAGYFHGKTKVNGDFYATTVTTTSDARLKTNIADVRADVLQQLTQLRPVQFKWQQTKIASADRTDTAKHEYLSNDIDFDKLHYGLLAQEVKNVFPSLVHEDSEGYLGVNYVELIPLLIQAINAQQQQITDLQSQLEDATNNASKKRNSPAKTSNATIFEQAELFQNNPNPFSIDTQIGYLLPLTTQSATLYIYNMNGLQLAEYPISSFGEGSVVVSAGSLQAGMYLYSLVADGQVIDTKRMILTK